MSDSPHGEQRSRGDRTIHPADLHLPPTEPIDVSALIAAAVVAQAPASAHSDLRAQ